VQGTCTSIPLREIGATEQGGGLKSRPVVALPSSTPQDPRGKSRWRKLEEPEHKKSPVGRGGEINLRD